ncbi:glycosyltransferase family 2 protein [Novosphingobium sp. ZW T3_23]|uniref:glycosyltransferase family 2 protein n=1 Tax=Novosphingobium sp. ZW T3_23 TaxID=3378084 RepID=UPI003853DCDF
MRARSRAWLTLAVHFDAVRLAPRAWLATLWWRMLGKRVRARAQFAPLLAASPRAYRLWLLSESIPETSDARDGPAIVALVEKGPGQADTIKSLRGQDVIVLPLGTTAVPDLSAAAEQIKWNSSPWIMPLMAGDIVAPHAIAAYQAAAIRAVGSIVYADDDILDSEGQRTEPHFKPAWNAELFRHFDYLTKACIVRTGRDTFISLSGSNWAAELVASALRGKGGANPPMRLPHILHHRRSRPNPCISAVVKPNSATLPKVSVIVPTRNRLDLLCTCLEGVERTDYPDLEVIVVDNGSDDPATLDYLANLDTARYRVLRAPGPFNFSTLNNRAAEIATGELLCLLNNDIEVLAPDWLITMVQQAQRPEVGAVGARLLYPDGRIQHAGVVMGICGGAAHAHRLLNPNEQGYFHRHALPQFVSAVTAACLVVRRKSFEAIGGLDEKNFAVAFNDVDLCMRLNAQGWQSLYEPRATLIHHESVSRGFDRDPVGAARLAGELAALKAAWRTGLELDEEIDPYHHPQLNRFSEHFVMRFRG